ncbi:DMT family transporter [Tunicatimonas pelagia]|uniref:DMT family transporter n=1 Tax=Tunicatimonas pelagia TaxID=931531 RepID=UPI0026659240|nr:DMT family transporter [Tunicatimonas pelagia]WKN40492.1 DMT family transporter [Tunicatimonas pelagia]
MNPYLLAILAILILGSAGAFIKIIALPPIVLTFFRTLIPTVLLFSYFKLIRRRRLFRYSAKWLLVGSLLNAGRLFLFIASYSYTSIVNAIVIFYTWPVFTVLYSRIWLKESIPRRNQILLFLPLIGIVIIFSDQQVTTDEQDLIGMGAMSLSSMLYAFTVLIFKRTSQEYTGFETVFFQNLLGGFIFLPFALPYLNKIDLPTYGLITLFSIFIGVLAFGMFFQALQKMRASTLSYLAYLEVVIASLYGILLFDETVTGQFVIGAVLIIVATLLFKKG